MPVIQKDATYVTQINHLKVAPENQDALIARMVEQVERNMANQPGFLSSTIHKSRDGRHIVNYVQFASTDLLDAAHARPEFRQQFETYKDLVLEAGPVIYDIAHLREG